MPDTLGCFRADFPNVRVHVEIAASGEIIERLLAGRVQLAIVGAEQAGDRIDLEPFVDDEIVGVAQPGLLPVEAGVVAPSALEGVMLLAREPESSTQELADAALRAAGVTPAGVWELGSSEAVKRAARARLGFAFLSRYAVAEEIERGELEHFRLAGRPPITRQFSIARLAGRPLSPGEQAFVDTLGRCCAASVTYAAACVR